MILALFSAPDRRIQENATIVGYSGCSDQRSPLLEAIEALRYTTFPKKRVTCFAFQQGELISPASNSLASRRILA
jgi:hypothetical protein